MQLIEVSNTILTFNSFVEAMSKAAIEKGIKAHGGFDSSKKMGTGEEEQDAYCIVGQSNEKINAIIPLYLHETHAKRVMLMRNNWLGYLFTLDSYGYEKNQEVGLLTLFGNMLTHFRNDEMYVEYMENVFNLCKKIITHSPNFKEAFPDSVYDKFVDSMIGRKRSIVPNLMTMLAISYVKDDLKRVIYSVYADFIKRYVEKIHAANTINAHAVAYNLMYGLGGHTEEIQNTDVQNVQTTLITNFEKEFERYYYDRNHYFQKYLYFLRNF